MLSSFSLKSGVFERFWRILSSPFTVLYIRRKTEDPCFERAPVRFFFQNRIAPLSNFAEKRSKDTCFSSYLTIKNPSKRPVASPRRKLKYHSFWKGKMRRKIHTCKWQIVPLISSFFYFLFFIFIIRNSKQRTQYSSKLLKNSLLRQKWRQYATGKVLQRLFNID